MNHYIIAIPEKYYIYEYSRYWMVQIRINDKKVTKNFTFSKFRNKLEALEQAKIYRDSLIKDHKIDIQDRFKKSTLEGIHRTFSRKNNGEKSYYWQADWYVNGKPNAKRFLVSKYGEENARQKAIEYRKNIIKLLNETGQTLFVKPKPNAKIWRYMDFTKFVYMLEKGALFFPIIDSFNDPYEGSYSRGNYTIRKFVYSRAKETNDLDELICKIKSVRPYIHANCWHINDFESAGMWKLYSKTNESICIQTEFRKLEMALPKEIKLGKVKYIDYKKKWIPESDIYYPFIYKRLSFEHEKELRAIFNSNNFEPKEKYEKSDNGYWVKVNMQTLIQKIYVSPDAQDWFVELVNKVKNKYKLTLKRVYKSPLNNDPYIKDNETEYSIM